MAAPSIHDGSSNENGQPRLPPIPSEAQRASLEFPTLKLPAVWTSEGITIRRSGLGFAALSRESSNLFDLQLARTHRRLYESQSLFVHSGSPLNPAGVHQRALIAIARRLADFWDLSPRMLTRLLGFEANQEDLIDRVERGNVMVPERDLADRVTALLRIRELLHGRYRDDREEERRWIRHQFVDLGDKTPLELMIDGGLEGVLTVRDYLRWTGEH